MFKLSELYTKVCNQSKIKLLNYIYIYIFINDLKNEKQAFKHTGMK